MWGLNQEYKSLENFVQIKSKQSVESFHIEKNSILLNFEHSETKTEKIFSTVSKKYLLDINGRIYEKNSGDLRLIRIN